MCEVECSSLGRNGVDKKDPQHSQGNGGNRRTTGLTVDCFLGVSGK